LNGVKFVVQKMWEFGVYARTSTMNLLLKQYAENGDGESAYALVSGIHIFMCICMYMCICIYKYIYIYVYIYIYLCKYVNT
jgi:hypothetical protein